MDRETGRSKGFGFVVMSSKEASEKAKAELSGAVRAHLRALLWGTATAVLCPVAAHCSTTQSHLRAPTASFEPRRTTCFI